MQIKGAYRALAISFFEKWAPEIATGTKWSIQNWFEISLNFSSPIFRNLAQKAFPFLNLSVFLDSILIPHPLIFSISFLFSCLWQWLTPSHKHKNQKYMHIRESLHTVAVLTTGTKKSDHSYWPPVEDSGKKDFEDETVTSAKASTVAGHNPGDAACPSYCSSCICDICLKTSRAWRRR